MTASPTPVALLQDVFGHASFQGNQQAIIDRTLAGRHSLVLMPTGGGKSLCYQLPALLLDGLTVVLSPLIALMKDQVDALTRRGLMRPSSTHHFPKNSGRPAMRASPRASTGCSTSRLSVSKRPTFVRLSPSDKYHCWPSTRLTASANGDMTSGLTTHGWVRSASYLVRHQPWP